MQTFNYKDYELKPHEMEDLLGGDFQTRDGWAQTFEVSKDGKTYYVRLGIANIDMAKTSRSVEELDGMFLEGARKGIELLDSEKERSVWNYFEYDPSNEWVPTTQKF